MTSHEVTVRDAAEDDLDDLARLCAQVQELHAVARPDLFAEPDAAQLRSFLRDRLGDSILLVAEADGRCVGYILAREFTRPENPFLRASRQMYIHHVGVDGAHRRGGVGTALLRATESVAHELGLGEVRLDSWAFNEPAHAFFRRNGYDPLNLVFSHTL